LPIRTLGEYLPFVFQFQAYFFGIKSRIAKSLQLLTTVVNAGGLPAGSRQEQLSVITRSETDRRKWSKLKGVNLLDGRTYQISMTPDPKQNKVFPDSFQVISNQYFGKPEVKSLAPDGARCGPGTKGLLRRAIVAVKSLIPVGKETDRYWEQSEDPSMPEAEIRVYGSSGKLVVADSLETKEWAKIGFRRLMRATNLTQKTIRSVLTGKGVRQQTMAVFRAGLGSLEI
jgi:hypothetical protein